MTGLALTVLLVPINSVLSVWMKKYQFKNMKLKDRRIKVMNEILDGMKVSSDLI